MERKTTSRKDVKDFVARCGRSMDRGVDPFDEWNERRIAEKRARLLVCIRGASELRALPCPCQGDITVIDFDSHGDGVCSCCGEKWHSDFSDVEFESDPEY
jgi:hypothetical protein